MFVLIEEFHSKMCYSVPTHLATTEEIALALQQPLSSGTELRLRRLMVEMFMYSTLTLEM